MGTSVRLWMTAGILIGAKLLLNAVNHGEPMVPRHQLRELSYRLGPWSGQEDPLEQRVVQAVSVSDYTNRVYVTQARTPIQLYIGYYSSQRTGDTIHSPKNCLPGAGWDPIRSGYTAIPISGTHQVVVNEYVIAQGLDRELVFYWYQGRGRVIASEYSSKFWMVADALTRHRTDGALVRLITPMKDGELNAHARLVGFAQMLYPQLGDLIPN